ncbi:hypothetical protein [Solitalea koreensis]|uniref:Uncharacterized protein n=1 Tax=Solitalea koreensis TaxID=543615 RepID=A0A521E7N8_9SPHI|nr:hypothetical protein [Solitalea koreensis]SMO79954.1 hypothetical protein SAMN06265350_11242 [Solitalea koreensis]
MKKLFSILIPVSIFVAAACTNAEKEKKLEDAHAKSLFDIAAMDSVYNQLINNQVKTITQKDSLMVLAKSRNDSAYNELRGRIRGYMARQKIVIDSMGKLVTDHKSVVDDVDIPGEKRQAVRADQIGLEDAYKKLQAQYKDLEDNLIDLKKEASEYR